MNSELIALAKRLLMKLEDQTVYEVNMEELLLTYLMKTQKMTKMKKKILFLKQKKVMVN